MGMMHDEMMEREIMANAGLITCPKCGSFIIRRSRMIEVIDAQDDAGKWTVEEETEAAAEYEDPVLYTCRACEYDWTSEDEAA